MNYITTVRLIYVFVIINLVELPNDPVIYIHPIILNTLWSSSSESWTFHILKIPLNQKKRTFVHWTCNAFILLKRHLKISIQRLILPYVSFHIYLTWYVTWLPYLSVYFYPWIGMRGFLKYSGAFIKRNQTSMSSKRKPLPGNWHWGW